jgi:hypothetical protein
MIIAPFTLAKNNTENNVTIYRIRILCMGGQYPWTEDEQPIEDILEPNGIYTKKVTNCKLSDGSLCALTEVDTQKTDMDSMYSWFEIEPTETETLCWRTFTFGMADKNVWLPIPMNNMKEIIQAIYNSQ